MQYLFGAIFLGLEIMIRSMKCQWFAWTGLVLFFAFGMVAYWVSVTPKVVSLKLNPDTSVEGISIFRILPGASLGIFIDFERSDGGRRPELGEFRSLGDWRDGYMEFLNPGSSVKLKLVGEGREIVYEALPASEYGKKVRRYLIPFVDDGNPDRFHRSVRHDLPAGFSEFSISVLEVEDPLKDEWVTLVFEQPLNFKFSLPPGYRWLWFFFFWPVFAFCILAYGLVLLWLLYRQRKKERNGG